MISIENFLILNIRNSKLCGFQWKLLLVWNYLESNGWIWNNLSCFQFSIVHFTITYFYLTFDLSYLILWPQLEILKLLIIFPCNKCEKKELPTVTEFSSDKAR